MPQIFWSLIILTILAVVLRQDWIYFLVYVVGGIWIVSHWWVRRTLAKLNVRRDVTEPRLCGRDDQGQPDLRKPYLAADSVAACPGTGPA